MERTDSLVYQERRDPSENLDSWDDGVMTETLVRRVATDQWAHPVCLKASLQRKAQREPTVLPDYPEFQVYLEDADPLVKPDSSDCLVNRE